MSKPAWLMETSMETPFGFPVVPEANKPSTTKHLDINTWDVISITTNYQSHISPNLGINVAYN